MGRLQRDRKKQWFFPEWAVVEKEWFWKIVSSYKIVTFEREPFLKNDCG